MRARDEREDLDDQNRWWRLDFTMVLVLLVVLAFLFLVTFEFWHSHMDLH